MRKLRKKIPVLLIAILIATVFTLGSIISGISLSGCKEAKEFKGTEKATEEIVEKHEEGKTKEGTLSQTSQVKEKEEEEEEEEEKKTLVEEKQALETKETETVEGTRKKKPVEGELTFKTKDGIEINGNIFGSGDKWVILSHMYPTDQKSWFNFTEYLAENGYIVLTYDFRGYGNSGGEKEISKIYMDLEAALKFIGQYNIEKVFLVGASMGGTASIIVASEEKIDEIKIDGVITISAPTEFKGLSAIDKIEKLTCPKLFIATKGDTFAAQSASTFFEKSKEPKEIQILDGSAHGTYIFEKEPQNAEKLKELILNFLNELSLTDS